jgi:tetratricopeptide (TPR) repeat protein
MFKRSSLIAAILIFPSVAFACLWDTDTLQMERSRFPGTLELITGKFLRHSNEFYEWRIKDRLEKLKSQPMNTSLYDDLAVAYDKTGQHDKAIETIRKKDRIRPGLYETEANLGTFLLHSGRLDEGLVHIKNAIKINPDAHFGREKYQQLLVEYVLTRKKDGKLPLPMSGVNVDASMNNFIRFLRKHSLHKDREEEFDAKDHTLRKEALKGLLGMMKFGKHDSPVLLEAVGAVLEDEVNPNGDAKQLAARAYLKAAMEVSDLVSKNNYRSMARYALMGQTNSSLETVEAHFQAELEDAKTWYADLREKELSWIRDGKNPEEEFNKFYTAEPEVESTDSNIKQDSQFVAGIKRLGMIYGGAVILILLAIFGLRRLLRSR